MRPLIFVALLTVTACGADGPPLTPTSQKASPDSAITISGEAAFGVSSGFN